MKASLGVALALAIPMMALSTVPDATTNSTRPPTNLKKVGDHWTPWDPPVPPEGARVYLIEKGDTLWDLAQRDLHDPYLWPRIWDQNRYILDSHWIYPGDPLIMPGPVTVVAEETMPPDVDPSDGDGTGSGDGQDTSVEEAALVPAPDGSGRPTRAAWMKPDPDSAADHSDMMCSGYILADKWESDTYVYASEEEGKIAFGPGDVVYINKGLSDGVQAGDKFFVVHQEVKVKHPVTGTMLGYFVRKEAVVQVIAAQAETATVELVDGCHPVHLGHSLIKFTELVSPKRRDIDLARYGVEDNEQASGYVVYAQNRLNAAGEGDIVYIDLGMADGIEKGDYLMIYRDVVSDQKPNEAGLARVRYKHKSSVPAHNTRRLPRGKEVPRKMLGHMVILASNHHTATAKVMYSWREIYPGDQVQLLD
jgi:hypothetical protein